MSSPSQVAEALRSRVLRLEVPAGVPLREIALAEEFECSRRTIREALLMLDREGVVTHERNRGASVRSFAEQDVRDLYRVRRTLEVQGALACVSASDQALKRVTEAAEALARAARSSQDSMEHAVADMRFHAAVIALIGSERIDRFFAEIATEMAYAIRLLQRDEVESATSADAVVEDHHRIARAVLARDADAAQRAMLDHIFENEDRLVRLCARLG